jgi:hypothetical protein
MPPSRKGKEADVFARDGRARTPLRAALVVPLGGANIIAICVAADVRRRMSLPAMVGRALRCAPPGRSAWGERPREPW